MQEATTYLNMDKAINRFIDYVCSLDIKEHHDSEHIKHLLLNFLHECFPSK